jgi:hypothetical protein
MSTRSRSGQRAGHRAPEQVGRRGDDAARGKFVGDGADIRIDAVHGGREHDGRRRSISLGSVRLGRIGLRRDQIAIEFAAFARADFYGLS